MLVTGDNPRAAARLAAEVGISDVRAGLLPQDKSGRRPGARPCRAHRRTRTARAVGGPMDLKSALHGVPKPLLLKLHPQSTFTDIEYLGRQAFRFTTPL